MNILVVDRDILSCLATISSIKKCYVNCKIKFAISIKDALEISSKSQIDVVFTEIDLGNESGFVLIDSLRNKFPNISVNFVCLSRDYAYDSIKYHPDGYYLKPLRTQDLLKSS